jgi:hypothetical protein
MNQIISKISFKKNKAQAAVTDSLFFLVIIVSLCILLFRFSSTYGLRVQNSISDLYFKEYTNSTMKTIFYTTVPLDFDLNLDKEVARDYLIVAIKQDFYADGIIGAGDINSLNTNDYVDIPKFNLFHTIKAIMKPLDSYDYVFYLQNTSQSGSLFSFFMIKTTNFTEDTTKDKYSKYQTYYDINGSSYYLCSPNTSQDVINIVSKGNKIYSSSVPLNFKKISDNSNGDIIDIKLNSTFAIWPATADITKNNLQSLNCNKIVN